MTAIDQKFDRVDHQFDLLRRDIAALNDRLTTFQDRMIQVGFGFVGVLMVEVIALVVALVR
jgi:hypothetical protein